MLEIENGRGETDMTKFIEYTDPEQNLRTILNMSMICAIIQTPEGNALIILNDKDKTKLKTVESYAEIRKALGFSVSD